LKKASVPPIRFHYLRHTCATLLLGKDVNLKIVSEMLGHSSISVTLDIYSHLLLDTQEKATRPSRKRCAEAAPGRYKQ
jgi:integrase